MAAHTERERLERLLLGQENIMEEVYLLLHDEQKQDDILKAMVRSSMKEHPARIAGIDPDRVYHRDSIKAICVQYRLRFLPGGLFKGTIPNQAVYALRGLERKSEAPLTSFMLMAPASRFKLCDSEVDPLLFVPMDNDLYYLVHKWGNDLGPIRRIVNWPLRTPAHLATLVVLFGLVLSLFVPTGILTSDPSASFWGLHRLLFLFWSIMVSASFTVFGWFAFFGQFSNDAWNSKYFN
ncbi:MAG TPA: hypothetical protein PLE78_07255 [Flavobacteriales bacterium]|nr:hypothetical protein [Flavobacteriales bacterium]HQW41180.1 hypothetical protein [Flavobacteriales bacterium]